MFHYTRRNTPERETSWRGYFRVIAPGQHSSFRKVSQRWRAVGNTVSDLTGPRFEIRTSRSRDSLATARPSGRCLLIVLHVSVLHEITLEFRRKETLETPRKINYPNFVPILFVAGTIEVWSVAPFLSTSF